MNTTQKTPNIDHLVARAKVLAHGRIRNAGRPRNLMLDSEAKIVSAMRKKGCSVSSIFRVMSEEKLTSYDKKEKFSFAYNQYKLHS